MYFQYDTSGAPLGFIYNGMQYLYLTNQMGDVISITDAQGNELVQYEYDEWGAVESIYTPHNSETENTLANTNPLRYRGYYYDSETGYYYLQSRYYDPSICRFINADSPKYTKDEKNKFSGICSFAYCLNNPTNNSDYYGNSSKKDFKTPKEALKKWANDNFKTSTKMNKELCALLYSYHKYRTYYYGYTGYAIGKKSSCDPVNQCKYYSRPENSYVVGTIHTHPNATVGGFSDQDFTYNKKYRLIGYVVCKKGVYSYIYTRKAGDIVRMLKYKLGRFA